MNLGLMLVPKSVLKDHRFRTRSEEKNARVAAFARLFGPPASGGTIPSSSGVPFLMGKRLTKTERMGILKRKDAAGNSVVSQGFLGTIKAAFIFYCRFPCEGYWFKFVTLRSPQGEKRYQLRWGG